MDTMFVL